MDLLYNLFSPATCKMVAHPLPWMNLWKSPWFSRWSIHFGDFPDVDSNGRHVVVARGDPKVMHGLLLLLTVGYWMIFPRSPATGETPSIGTGPRHFGAESEDDLLQRVLRNASVTRKLREATCGGGVSFWIRCSLWTSVSCVNCPVKQPWSKSNTHEYPQCSRFKPPAMVSWYLTESQLIVELCFAGSKG